MLPCYLTSHPAMENRALRARSARNERACEFDGEQNGCRRALVPEVTLVVNKANLAKKLSS